MGGGAVVDWTGATANGLEWNVSGQGRFEVLEGGLLASSLYIMIFGL
jgi:hypothetical protein